MLLVCLFMLIESCYKVELIYALALSLSPPLTTLVGVTGALILDNVPRQLRLGRELNGTRLTLVGTFRGSPAERGE